MIKRRRKKTTIEGFLDDLSMFAFGRRRSEAMKEGRCVRCGKPPGNFRDKTSEAEFAISRLCQECQDWFFAGEE